MHIAYVYIEHPIMELDRAFTYRCDGFSLCRGVRVRVPFGKKNTPLIGFVEKVEEIEESEQIAQAYELKSILAVIDDKPLINEELFALAKWMAKTCVAPLISCFQCMLPSKLKPKRTMSAVKQEAWVVYDHTPMQLTKRQEEICHIMEMRKEMLRSVFYQEFKSAGKRLIEAGALYVEQRDAKAVLHVNKENEAPFTLTKSQKAALDAIMQGDPKQVYLLHGVTGSGKSEVFLQMAQRVLDQGKQVLILVPEISLTPQMMERVERRFQGQAAIYHSGLNAQEKYEQYMLVKQHHVSVVVGTRSAVFMPFDALGLIIMDEEHDTSYKQDVAPRYHCRDVAVFRAKHHHCPLILASATPSLESYARAYKGVYQLVEMPKRINDSLPEVRLVDMKDNLVKGGNTLLSRELEQAVEERLQRHEQVILLLNRRGYTPILRCIECGYVQMCSHCDMAMNYHKDENVLKCHTCGATMPLPKECPQCHKSAWRYLGMGTQRLEEYVKRRFPKASILRMDADTTARKFAHEKLLAKFRRHEADILLGTQMIAKGLDFDQVTLVGILNGDAMLNRSDYRSAELTYDLLEQAAGRSGRHDKAGEVIIQAYDTTHYAIQCAAHHDYRGFFAQEMQYRHLAGYPPYAYLASMVFRHRQEEVAMDCAVATIAQLDHDSEIRILGPGCLGKSRDEYRVRILLKGKDPLILNEMVWDVYHRHLTEKKKVAMEIDLQPLILE